MYEKTTNKEHIDPFVEDIREIYDFEKLKGWPLDRLEGEEWLLENEIERFKITFPSQESVLQGEERAFVMDNPNETKKALTDAELLRLNHIKKEAISEINQAIQNRREKHQEQQHELLNSATNFIEQASLMVLSIRSTIQKILPW